MTLLEVDMPYGFDHPKMKSFFKYFNDNFDPDTVWLQFPSGKVPY